MKFADADHFHVTHCVTSIATDQDKLPTDGTGFHLLGRLAGQPVTAAATWLPALDAGKECLGLPALRPSEFSRTVEEMAHRLSAAPPVN
jgi:hypothetical protein